MSEPETTRGIPPLQPRELSAEEERLLNHPLFRRNPPPDCLAPLSEHTSRFTAWMRRRAGEPGEERSYFRGWHDALMEIASEIEANEMERCGHAKQD